ncbi:glycosyltransferase [Brachybacterium saurashtrense]|uniref:Glycosyltransferase n=1 Tax=Brachybacterium saurashtrense TaxID=556288 RepID=A0A345YLU7_9MICO|nr:glycosyltransferase [Brachybacterium saurashtrense]AXK44899.1 glycosyltransferase [Brachybacterium saurashtrense]RRR21583.1 glycosyltransferase [Brachybacterium saurashtrense]
MTVLLVRPAASGGLAAHVDHELRLLREAGAAVREAPVRIRERPHPLEDLRTVRALRRTVADTPGATTVHAHGLRAGALAALAVTGRRRDRLVVTLHNRTVGSRPVRTVGALLLRVLARRADVVLAVSPDLASDARRAGARDVRHAVIPAPRTAPGPDPSRPDRPGERAPSTDDAPAEDLQDRTGAAHDEAGAAPDEAGAATLEVLVIARLAPQKGLHDLLEAARLLRQSGPVRVRIAGEGPLREELAVRIEADRLPVELLGRREDVPALLAACDAVASAAHWEGQPVALQEALRAGAAIVATDAGGTRWVTGDAASLVPVGDAAGLARALAALRDPSARDAARAASRRRAHELPDDEALRTQLAEVLAPGARTW